MKDLSIDFGSIDQNNIEQLRKLNDTIFPISYGPKFYTSVLSHPPSLTKYAYYNGFVIGAICTRLEEHPELVGKKRAYIMTLGVLSSYRGRGVGKKLVASVLEELQGCGSSSGEEVGVKRKREDGADEEEGEKKADEASEKEKAKEAEKTKESEKYLDVVDVYVHTQTNNNDAINFYSKFEFVKGGVIKDYYKRIDPPDAVILRKELRSSE